MLHDMKLKMNFDRITRFRFATTHKILMLNGYFKLGKNLRNSRGFDASLRRKDEIRSHGVSFPVMNRAS